MTRPVKCFILLIALGGAACSTSTPAGTAPASAASTPAATAAEPPDVALELGRTPTPLPERWIEAAEPGQSRQYFEDMLSVSQDDTAVRGHLVITGDAGGTPQRYTLTEFHLRIPSGQPTTLERTTLSRGLLRVEQGRDDNGPATIYRLVADPPESRALAFVKDGTRLAVASVDRGRVTRQGAVGQALVGSSTDTMLVVTGEADAAMKWKVRLRKGQHLDVQLAPLSAGRTWELSKGLEAATLVSRPGSTAPVADAEQPDGRIQVFRFAAAAPGWSDLRFEHGILKMTVRVKTEG